MKEPIFDHESTVLYKTLGITEEEFLEIKAFVIDVSTKRLTKRRRCNSGIILEECYKQGYNPIEMALVGYILGKADAQRECPLHSESFLQILRGERNQDGDIDSDEEDLY